MNKYKHIGTLEEMRDHHLELILSWRNDDNVRNNMYSNHIISLDEHRAWWDRIKSSKENIYFVYMRNGIPSGVVGINNIDTKNSNSFWEFYAAPSAAKGTGSRMEFLALTFVFDDLNLHKLNCEVIAFNKPVIELHRKFGFNVEGIFRENYKRNEEFIDVYRMGILNREWQRRKQKLLESLLQK